MTPFPLMKRIAPYLIIYCALLCAGSTRAQVSRLKSDICYDASLQATAGSGDVAPFWFTANRYGLGTIEPNSALVRAAVQRRAEADSLRHWRIGYGLDLVAAVNHTSHFLVQQAYADLQYKSLRLSIGQKERPMELRNQRLSSGAMTTGINARPLPQVRLGLPEFLSFPRTGHWLALKAHIAYGMLTDNRWQRHFTQGTANLYTANSLYHSKAGFLRIGNTSRFPLTLTGGIEMSCQFGGEAWNLRDREDHTGAFESHQKLSHGFKAFWHAFIPGGSDVNDGDFSNIEGNQLGSWHLRADFDLHGWGASFYAEHFFEDHSQLGPFVYNWRDMQYGAELRLPHNPVVSAIVYEHLRTTHQSGPIYHDKTAALPTSIAGVDNYYNHHVYAAWQHAGMALGHPLLLSPIYNTKGQIAFRDNRVLAHHIGIEGQPAKEVSYRVLFTHERSWGTYATPRINPAKGTYLLAEATYAPRQVPGLSLTAAYGQNSGALLGNAKGAMLTISYSGMFRNHRE